MLVNFFSRKFKLLLLWTTIAIISINWLTTTSPHIPEASKRIKGVWMTHVGTSFLSYTSLIDNIFNELSRLNFNRVYVDVYNGGTIYPSRYVNKTKWAFLPFIDPLKIAIEQGQRQGLKIYGWYEHGMMLFPSDRLAKKHPDWLLQTPKGDKIVDEHLWLDPKNLQVQKYFVDLFTEVAKKYPKLYGIQLDDHWGIPREFGNKEIAMTNLTRQVVRAIKTVRKDLVFSLAPNPIQFASRRYAQNWLNWIDEELVDEAIVQIYRSTSRDVRLSIPASGLLEAKKHIPVGIGIYAGNFRNLQSRSEIDRQVAIVEELNYGYSIFCWEYAFSFLRRLSFLIQKI
jgi:uncharacterized lipoprotein YddW (UPF0748 family)